MVKAGDKMKDSGDGLSTSSRDEEDGAEQEENGCSTALVTNGASHNTNRIARNWAEKKRRDKLNESIQKLSSMVPFVSNTPKRMDKTSILRLSATYLRQHMIHCQVMSQNKEAPEFLNAINWCQFLLEDEDRIMVIMTAKAKLILVSDNVEKILGHTSLELLGQNFRTIVAPEDHPELTKCLKPNVNDEYLSEKVIASSPSTVSLTRSCYLRLMHRCLARSEQPQYELVHLVGKLVVPKKLAVQLSRDEAAEHKEPNQNEIILIAVLTPHRERRVTELSLMEPSKDEYVTRHTLDGLILYSDHRLSHLTGYMPSEVVGRQAFSYMHPEDAFYVMSVLREMYLTGKNYGLSIYRLRIKNGEYIYLKSYGLFEFSANNETLSSFICVNKLVPKDEGERDLTALKRKYSPIVTRTSVTQSIWIESEITMSDPSIVTGCLDIAVKQMIANMPNLKQSTVLDDPQKALLIPYQTAKIVSKMLPPLDQQIKTIGVDLKSPFALSSASPSGGGGSSGDDDDDDDDEPQQQQRQSSHQPSGLSPSSKLSSPHAAVASPHGAIATKTQNRPSVLRLASSGRQSITTYTNEQEGGGAITSTTDVAGGGVATCRDRPEDRTTNGSGGNRLKIGCLVEVKQEVYERKYPAGVNEIRKSGSIITSGSVVQCGERLDGDGSTVRYSTAMKRQKDVADDDYLVSPVPTKKCAAVVSRVDMVAAAPIAADEQSPFRAIAPTLKNETDDLPPFDDRLFPLTNDPQLKHELSDPLELPIGDFGHMSKLIGDEFFERRTEPERMFQLLDSRILRQGAQLDAIQGEASYINSPSMKYRLSELTEDLSRQTHCLETLRRDHHELQF